MVTVNNVHIMTNMTLTGLVMNTTGMIDMKDMTDMTVDQVINTLQLKFSSKPGNLFLLNDYNLTCSADSTEHI